MRLDAYLKFGGFSLVSWIPWTLHRLSQNQPAGTGHQVGPVRAHKGPSYHPGARLLSCPCSQNRYWLLSQTTVLRRRASLFTFLLPAFHICPQKCPFRSYGLGHSRSLRKRASGHKLLNIVSLLGAFYEFQVWSRGGSLLMSRGAAMTKTWLSSESFKGIL